jgi:hypothetical protein
MVGVMMWRFIFNTSLSYYHTKKLAAEQAKEHGYKMFTWYESVDCAVYAVDNPEKPLFLLKDVGLIDG